ncbi:MAG: glycosyltransferase [Halobacteriaceae archaeon]
MTPSELVKTNVREFGRPADAIDVIPTGIEFATIRSVEPDESVDIVYARRLDEDANLENLLLALAELRDRDWRCAVVGDGPARAGYESEARDLRIADRVRFTGDLPLRERLALFRGAHVYVHTARRAAFPLDLVRALAAGCLGVVSYEAASAAHEFVEAHRRGFLTTSPEEITAAIEASGEYEHCTIDEGFAEYDQTAVMDRYLQRYRELGVRT